MDNSSKEMLRTLPIVKNKKQLDPEKNYTEYGLAAKPSELRAITWRIQNFSVEEQSKYADKFCIEGCQTSNNNYFKNLQLPESIDAELTTNADYYSTTAIANLAYCSLHLKNSQERKKCERYHQKLIEARKKSVEAHRRGKDIVLVLMLFTAVGLAIVMQRIMHITKAL